MKIGIPATSIKALVVAAFAACLVLPAAAAEVRPTLDLPDYVIDTELPMVGATAAIRERQFFWIDNNRILAHDIVPKDKARGWDGGEVHLLQIVDIRKPGKLQPYKRTDYLTSLCVGQGNVFYAHRAPEKSAGGMVFHYMSGPLGKERPTTVRGEAMTGPRTRAFDQFSCQFKAVPKPLQFRLWEPLLLGHGSLDFGVRGKGHDSEKPLTYLPSSGGEPLALPIIADHIYYLDNVYHPWKGAYLLKGIRLSLKLNGCQRIWWLWPGGRTQQICISSKPEPYEVWPTKIGLLYGYFVQRADNSFHRDTGLYLYADGKAKRLMTGRILLIEVSPDGCKIASQHPWLNYLPRPLPDRALTIRVIDLCANRARLQP